MFASYLWTSNAGYFFLAARSSKVILEFAIRQDLMVNDLQSKNLKTLPKKEELRWNLEEQMFTYDPNLWKFVADLKYLILTIVASVGEGTLSCGGNTDNN